MCIQCTYYSEGKKIFSEVFPQQPLPKYLDFMCIECTYYAQGKTIFCKLFQHKPLLKWSVFMCIECPYYDQGKTLFPAVFQCRQLLKSFFFTCIECTYHLELTKCTAVCWAVIWTNVGHSNIHIMFITGPHYDILTYKNALGPLG